MGKPSTLPWLRTIVREFLRLPESDDVDQWTLPELGATSLQAIALQFRVLQETSVKVGMAELAGGSHVAEIAELIDARIDAREADRLLTS